MGAWGPGARKRRVTGEKLEIPCHYPSAITESVFPVKAGILLLVIQSYPIWCFADDYFA